MCATSAGGFSHPPPLGCTRPAARSTRCRFSKGPKAQKKAPRSARCSPRGPPIRRLISAPRIASSRSAASGGTSWRSLTATGGTRPPSSRHSFHRLVTTTAPRSAAPPSAPRAGSCSSQRSTPDANTSSTRQAAADGGRSRWGRRTPSISTASRETVSRFGRRRAMSTRAASDGGQTAPRSKTCAPRSRGRARRAMCGSVGSRRTSRSASRARPRPWTSC